MRAVGFPRLPLLLPNSCLLSGVLTFLPSTRPHPAGFAWRKSQISIAQLETDSSAVPTEWNSVHARRSCRKNSRVSAKEYTWAV